MNDDILFVGKWLLLAESYPNLLKAPHSNFDRERISKRVVGECLRSYQLYSSNASCPHIHIRFFLYTRPALPNSFAIIYTHNRKAASIISLRTC